MGTLEVTTKNVYGNKLIYPINATAKKFAYLTNTKTLSESTLKVAESLGFEIEKKQLLIKSGWRGATNTKPTLIIKEQGGSKMTNSNNTCSDRIAQSWANRSEDLREFQNSEELENSEGIYLGEYALSFDFVAPDTFDNQPYGYWRYQISYGGPTEEIRFLTDYNEEAREQECYFEKDVITAVEFAFLDWFDGATMTLEDDDKDLAMWVYEMHRPEGA